MSYSNNLYGCTASHKTRLNQTQMSIDQGFFSRNENHFYRTAIPVTSNRTHLWGSPSNAVTEKAAASRSVKRGLKTSEGGKTSEVFLDEF